MWTKRTGAPAVLLRFFASLKLTVVLFALSIFLIFAGTLAQVDQGIWAVMDQYFRTPVAWIEFKVFFPRTWGEIPGAFPYPGGYLLGAVVLANLLAAHAARFKLSWRRSGIIILHAGLIVMIVSEFVTAFMATEGRMTIFEGSSSNYVEDIRTVELAVIDRSREGDDEVAVIPEARLRAGGLIGDEHLPFDVEVRRYLVNSAIVEATALPDGAPNPANAGYGRGSVAVERPAVSGADPDQEVDAASAYVTLRDKESGEPFGTYLVSQWFGFQDGMAQEVAVGGTSYEIDLRFERSYRDYTMHLIKFSHDKYIGTDRAKNFSSDLRLIDPKNNVNRQVRISMNNPLRYEGETFYQASFLPDNTATILHVVRNPGWLMPYISCAMVSGGLLIHFLLGLTRFLKRRRFES